MKKQTRKSKAFNFQYYNIIVFFFFFLISGRQKCNLTFKTCSWKGYVSGSMGKKIFLPLIEKGRLCGKRAMGKKIPLPASPLLALEDGVTEVRFSQCCRVCLSFKEVPQNMLHSLPLGNSRHLGPNMSLLLENGKGGRRTSGEAVLCTLGWLAVPLASSRAPRGW